MEIKQNKMTIFYRKSTGDLTDISPGEQNFEFYGRLAGDYKLIYNFIVVDYDEYVMLNAEKFNIIDDQIKIKQNEDLSKYM
jgi:hypothetical protein